jgi:hypothetical protein
MFIFCWDESPCKAIAICETFSNFTLTSIYAELLRWLPSDTITVTRDVVLDEEDFEVANKTLPLE